MSKIFDSLDAQLNSSEGRKRLDSSEGRKRLDIYDSSTHVDFVLLTRVDTSN